MIENIINLLTRKKIYVKYIISGGTVTLVHFSILFILHELFFIDVIVATTCAFLFSFFVGFFLHKRWTFRNKDTRIYHQMFKFLSLGIFGLVLNAGLMYLLVNIFLIWYMLAQVFVSASIAVMNFLISRFIIFRNVDTAEKKPDKKNPRVLITTGIYPPDIGGPATFVYSLRHALQSHGVDVKIVAYGAKKHDDKNVFIVFRKQNIIARYFKFFLQVWHLSRCTDVIYTFDIISAGYPSALVKLFRPDLKLVIRLGGDHLWEKALQAGWYDDILEKYYQEKKFNKTEKRIFRINNFVLKQADALIFNAEILKDIYSRARNMREKDLKVIKNFQKNINHNNDFTVAGKPRVLYIGRLVAFKNILRLIRAWEKLIKDNKAGGAGLKIIGDGPEEGKLKKYVKDHGLDKEIEILPKISHENAYKEIRQASVVAIPSLTEVNAHVVSEAETMQKNIVLSKFSESFFARDRYPGLFYVNPLDVNDIADKLYMALNSPNKLLKEETIAKTGDVISWQTADVVKSHLDLFKELNNK